MGIVTTRSEFRKALKEVLLSIPPDFVFDKVYIIEQFSARYPDTYLAFCALFADRREPMESAIEAIHAAIETFEGVLVEEQSLKAHFPRLYSSLSSRRVWKKI